MTDLDLIRPCDGCPFSRGPKAVLHLRPERLREIIASEGGFPCHQTNPSTSPGGSRKVRPQECAGYLIYHLVNGTAPQLMRIAGRLGMIREEELLKHEAEVVTNFRELVRRHQRGHECTSGGQDPRQGSGTRSSSSRTRSRSRPRARRG